MSLNKEIQNDQIPLFTINRLRKAKTITEVIVIKLNANCNANFSREDKKYVRGYADAVQEHFRYKLFE